MNVFSWDDDDETQASTVKSRSTKKPTTKEVSAVKVRTSLKSVTIYVLKNIPKVWWDNLLKKMPKNLLYIY